MIYEYYWKLAEQTVVSQILLIMGGFFLFSVRKTHFCARLALCKIPLYLIFIGVFYEENAIYNCYVRCIGKRSVCTRRLKPLQVKKAVLTITTSKSRRLFYLSGDTTKSGHFLSFYITHWCHAVKFQPKSQH